MQNFMSNMMPGGGQQGGVDDGVPWWMKYAGKAAGVVGGVGESGTRGANSGFWPVLRSLIRKPMVNSFSFFCYVVAVVRLQ